MQYSYARRLFEALVPPGSCYDCIRKVMKPKQIGRLNKMFENLRFARGLKARSGKCPRCSEDRAEIWQVLSG